MPSSTEQHLSFIVHHIRGMKADRVLDVGVGFGKWGFLCREYLESFPGHPYPEDWEVSIYGIEAFREYTLRFQWLHLLYDKIFIGPMQDVVPTLTEPYDLIIVGDVLEHVTKAEGLIVIQDLWRLTRKRLILSLPIGPRWIGNSIVCGNEYEAHRGVWAEEEPERVIQQKAKAKQAVTESRGDIVAYVFDK
ncbi:MAG: class I SAM-dependent methyltransferase [Deltaproteobacteria bacterium]|nr:class I SAM-dependent methyltransferase [Deltaproteobacteria bacterium]